MLSLGVVLALAFIAVIILVIFFQFIPFGLWLTALFSGIRVPFFTLFGMRFRRVDPRAIVLPLISGHKAGIELNVNDLEGHFLAGGNVNRVVNALISADKAGIALTYKQATAIDLAGRDVFEAVQVSVNPKVITTPKVAAMAKDGIQLLALARVTVRANINRLVGGAGEETILARVGEGIVSTIGSAVSHKAVLENPDLISKTVLAKGLDAGTAFEILSIDIADVDVGKNIGHRGGVPERQPRRHGLPALPEHPGRHHHAGGDRGRGQRAHDNRRELIDGSRAAGRSGSHVGGAQRAAKGRE